MGVAMIAHGLQLVIMCYFYQLPSPSLRTTIFPELSPCRYIRQRLVAARGVVFRLHFWHIIQESAYPPLHTMHANLVYLHFLQVPMVGYCTGRPTPHRAFQGCSEGTAPLASLFRPQLTCLQSCPLTDTAVA